MNDDVPDSKRGSKSIGEDGDLDADAAARAKRGVITPVTVPQDQGRSSGHGRDGPIPIRKS